VWDVWFGRDANYSKTQSTPNDSYSSIDGILPGKQHQILPTILLNLKKKFQSTRLFQPKYSFIRELRVHNT